jgi:tetratricopeptide (TPR) repeat protein
MVRKHPKFDERIQKNIVRLCEHTSESLTSKVVPLLKILLIVFACLAVYIPAIRSGFAWDDDSMLTESIALKEDGLYKCWFTSQQPNYWPITWTSYWLEHKLWELKPAGYHITNILIHLACTLLIWRILVQLNVPAAFAAALIFAVHPVNVESVAWIAQRKTVLAMLFFLLALFYYLRFDQAGKRVFYALSVTLFILAMLSKGSVVGLPVVILLCVWWLHKTIARRDILRSIPFFVVSAVMSAVEIWFQYNRAIGEDVVRSDSFFSRLAGAGWAVWFYLYKAILPIHLTFIYPRWKIDPTNLVSYVPGLLLLVLLALAWRHRRSWGRPVFFALSFYIVMLLPVLGFFNIYFMRYSLVADHYQYVSIISVIALVIGVVYRYLGAGVLRIAAVFALMILGTAAWQQSSTYRNAETLWYDTLAKDPNSWMAHNNLGSALQLQGKYEEAVSHYRKTLQVNPDSDKAYYNLGMVFGLQGKSDEAIGYFRRALQINPNYAEVHFNLGIVLQTQGKLQEAISHYQEGLRINPNDADVHNNWANALQTLGRPDEAINHYYQAIQIKPNYAQVHNNLGIILKSQGKIDEAVKHYRRAIQIKPDYAEAHNNLANALVSQGKLDEAVSHFREALRLKADNPDICYNLALALQSQNKFDEAIAPYRQALRLKPDWPLPMNGLAWVLATHPDPAMRDPNQAIELAEQADKITNHRNPLVLNTLAAGYAAAGRFDQAVITAQKALDLASAGKNNNLADQILKKLELYRQKKY